jgi:3-hydroxyacyl-CoA dehydrogenase
MFYADQTGLSHVARRLEEIAQQTGEEALRPAPLLSRLAAGGKDFASLVTAGQAS